MSNAIYNKNQKNKESVKSNMSESQKNVIERFLLLCQNEKPVDFIKARKYDADICTKFKLGLCNDSVIKALKEEFDKKDLVDSGIFRGNDRLYALYKDRVIFTYFGKSIYYSARSQNSNIDKTKKHLFPKKTIVGCKQPYVLDGINKDLILCEGETDAIALKHIFPETNILGVGGVQSAKNYITHLPPDVEKIMLCFDNDEKGKEFEKDIAKQLNHNDLTCFKIEFPSEFKDIDDVWREHQSNAKNQIKIREALLVSDKFKSPDLLKEIYLNINEKHQFDNNAKMAVFLIACTAELFDEHDHTSVALKGESSSGKDNCMETILSLFPETDSFFITRATQSALEEETQKVNRIAFSEINKERDGANAELTEFVKQLSEGGTNVIKRDISQNIINIKTSQKTVLYATTETAIDDELITRFVIVPISSCPIKNRSVVSTTLKKAANLKLKQDHTVWFRESIDGLKQYDVEIPFAECLEDIFDFNFDRIKRDVKRMLAIVKASAWLHQKQRVIKDNIILAEPADWYIMQTIFSKFMNTTYNNIDPRHEAIIHEIQSAQKLKEHDGIIASNNFENKFLGWAVKSEICKKLGINHETFKKRVKWLKDEGFVQTYYNPDVSRTISLLDVGGYEVGTRSVLSGDANTLYQRITHHITTYNLNILYDNKIFNKPDLCFLDEGLTTKVPLSEKNTHLSHTQVQKINNRSKVSKDFKEYILSKSEHSTDELVNKFGENKVQGAVTDGTLVQRKAGLLVASK